MRCSALATCVTKRPLSLKTRKRAFTEASNRIGPFSCLNKHFATMTLKLGIKYLKTYWISTAFFGYMILTTILKAFTSIDMTIPCLNYYFTGHTCWGCGMTTAAVYLLKLDVRAAIETNPLVFIVLPTLTFLIVRHWRRFKAEQLSKGFPNYSE